MERATSAEMAASTLPMTCMEAVWPRWTRAEKPAGMTMTASSVPSAARARARAALPSVWMVISPLRLTAGRTCWVNAWLAAPWSASTTPRLMTPEPPETPLKITLKMNARPSGTTTPMSRAERSRSRAFRSLTQMSQEARTGSVPQSPAGQMQEDGLEVRLGHLDRPDQHAGRGHLGQDGGQLAPGVVHDQVDAPVECPGLPDPGPAGQVLRRAGQVTGRGQPDLVPLADQAHQFVPRALGDELAVVDDADPVAQPFGLFHVVRGVQHGHPGAGQPFHALQDRVPALRVDPDRGFVQDQQLRLVQQADADVETPLHPAGVLLDLVAGPVGQAGQVEHLVGAASRPRGRHAVEPGEEHEVLAARQVRVDGQVLGHVAERALGPHRVRRHRLPGHGHLAGVAFEQADDHRDSRGLACPVRAEQPVGLTRGDVEADPVHRDELAEAAPQAAALQYVLPVHRPPRRRAQHIGAWTARAYGRLPGPHRITAAGPSPRAPAGRWSGAGRRLAGRREPSRARRRPRARAWAWSPRPRPAGRSRRSPVNEPRSARRPARYAPALPAAHPWASGRRASGWRRHAPPARPRALPSAGCAARPARRRARSAAGPAAAAPGTAPWRPRR